MRELVNEYLMQVAVLHNPQQAYSLFSPSVQERVPFDEFLKFTEASVITDETMFIDYELDPEVGYVYVKTQNEESIRFVLRMEGDEWKLMEIVDDNGYYFNDRGLQEFQTEGNNTDPIDDESTEEESMDETTTNEMDIDEDDMESLALAHDIMRRFGKSLADGNFDEFYGSISNAWKKEVSAEELTTNFKSFYLYEEEINDIISMNFPRFQEKPSYIADGLGHKIAGKYETETDILEFKMIFIDEDNIWLLMGLDVKFHSK
ncbi:MAG: hypothetical protein OEY56_09990 [Cyclobacteriaceae bacterium]|nr:hypothetical protein [Cyclobacteriaceae bacterium]